MFWKEEKGQSLTEFAVIVPVLLLLICGIFDFGRLLYGYLQLNLVAQESVRLGGLGKKDAEIMQYARDHVHIGDPAKLQVTITPTDTTRKSGQYVTVKLAQPLQYMTPVIAKIIPPPTIRADSTIRVE